MNERHVRLASNEAVFREVNERIGDITAHRFRSNSAEFVCECSLTECSERIELELDRYQQVRQDSALFILVPGHEVEEIERVIEEGSGYVIVEKTGDGRAYAAESDPRRTD